MDLLLFIKGIFVGFSVSVPLGPIGILCVQRTIAKGRWSGFYSGIGAAISDTTYAIIAGFSLNFIIDFIKSQEIFFQIIGAVVLTLLGIKIFFSDPEIIERKAKYRTDTLLNDIISSFLVTISNPLAIFVFIAVFAGLGIASQISGWLSTLIIIIGVFSGACLWWFTLASVVNIFRHKINVNRLRWLNRIAGTTIIVLVIISVISILIFK